MVVILYFYSAGSLKRVSLFLVLVAALFSLAGPALAREAAPPTPGASVVVNDTPQPTRQILIESSIKEGKSEKLGVNWERAGHLGFGHLNEAASRMLGACIGVGEANGGFRTVSAPRMLVAIGQTVSIKQAHCWDCRHYYVTAGHTEEVAMELKITPHLEEDGQVVTLDLELKNITAGAALSDGDHSSDIRQAKIMVKDGDTVVIGGIMTDSQGRLPLLGWLSPDKAANIEYELLIFITPNIIPISS